MMTTQVEDFLDGLYDSDRESHKLVNQAILVLERHGPAEGPWRSAVLLVAGDKSGKWARWYQTAIPEAERRYADYLAEREKEMGL